MCAIIVVLRRLGFWYWSLVIYIPLFDQLAVLLICRCWELGMLYFSLFVEKLSSSLQSMFRIRVVSLIYFHFRI